MRGKTEVAHCTWKGCGDRVCCQDVQESPSASYIVPNLCRRGPEVSVQSVYQEESGQVQT